MYKHTYAKLINKSVNKGSESRHYKLGRDQQGASGFSKKTSWRRVGVGAWDGIGWSGWELTDVLLMSYVSSCHAMARTKQHCTAQVWTKEPEKERGGWKTKTEHWVVEKQRHYATKTDRDWQKERENRKKEHQWATQWIKCVLTSLPFY